MAQLPLERCIRFWTTTNFENANRGMRKPPRCQRREIHVPHGNPILPMFTAAEAALSGFTQADYEAIDFLDVPFSAVAPSTPVAKRHEYITLDRILRLGGTPGCKACAFDAVTHTRICKARFDALIKAEKLAASKSVKDAAPPAVELPDPSPASAPAASEGEGAAPASASSHPDPPAPAVVAQQSPANEPTRESCVLSEKFLGERKGTEPSPKGQGSSWG